MDQAGNGLNLIDFGVVCSCAITGISDSLLDFTLHDVIREVVVRTCHDSSYCRSRFSTINRTLVPLRKIYDVGVKRFVTRICVCVLF